MPALRFKSSWSLYKCRHCTINELILCMTITTHILLWGRPSPHGCEVQVCFESTSYNHLQRQTSPWKNHICQPRYLPRPLIPCLWKGSRQIILRGRYFAGSKRFHSSLGVLPSNSEATLWQRGSDWFLWDSCAIASSVFRFSIGVGEFKCVRTCIRRVVNRGVWCVGWLTALRRCTKRMVSLTSRFAHSVFSDSSLSTFSNRDSRFNAATRCKPSRDFFPLGGHQCRNKSGFSVKFKWCRI